MPRLPRAGWLAVGALVAALLTASDRFALPLWLVLGLALGSLALALVTAAVRRAEATALLVAFGTVGLRAGMATALTVGAPAVAPLEAGSGEWQGAVSDVSSPSGAEQRAFVSLRAPGGGTWLVYAWLPRHPALVPGDAIEVRGQLQAPPADAPGFAGFLESRGAVGTLKGHAMRLVGSTGGFTAAVEGLRWGLDRTLSRAIPEPEAGLASGILIGLRERVSRATADDFTVTGLTHVVAISGWNIALVAGIATALLRSTGLGRRPRSAIVVVAIVAYTVLAGAEASVIRAAVMGGVVIIARESGRPSGAAAALGLACWGLLLAQPTMIDDIGLQLSLAATAGLLALGAPAEAGVRRVTRGRGPRWFSETLGVSLAAQLSTLPLVLLHFGRLSLISPLANLLVAPVVPLAMLGAAIGTVVGPLIVGSLAATLLAPLLIAAWLPLALMTRGAGLLAQVPLANLELVPPFDLVGAGVALAALVLALHRAGRTSAVPPSPSPPRPTPTPRHRRAPAALLVMALVAATSVALVARPTPALQVSVLDIGQGDAILLEAGDGTRLLVDGGPDPDLLVRRLDERIPAWDRHIDLALLTHPHEDHAGGLAGLAPRYRVGPPHRDGHELGGVRGAGAACGRDPSRHAADPPEPGGLVQPGSSPGRRTLATARCHPRPDPHRWTGHQRHLHRARGQPGASTHPAHWRSGGRPRRRPARGHPSRRSSLGPAEGGPSRQRHRLQPSPAGGLATTARGGQLRPWQPLWPPGPGHPPTAPPDRGHGLAHRPRGHAFGDLRRTDPVGDGAAGRPGASHLPERSLPAHAGRDQSCRPLLHSTRWRYPPEPKRFPCSSRRRLHPGCCST